MAFDVFVSHASADATVANAIVARLEQTGIRCWIAPRDIRPGTPWPQAIVQALEACRVLVVVVSETANRSPQIEREVGLAVERRLFILPFRIDDVALSRSLAYYLQAPHWLDAMTPPLERHIERLQAAVAELLQMGPAHTRTAAASADSTAAAPTAPPEISPDEWGRRRRRGVLAWLRQALMDRE